MQNNLAKLFLLIFLISCTHSVHLVHVGDFKPYQKISSGKTVEASASRKVILGFKMDTTYIEKARAQLIDQCRGGTLQGPVTRISTSHGFFHWTDKVHMRALCIKSL